MDNFVGDIGLPRQTAANVATWAVENAQIARTAPTFDSVNPQPHRLGLVTAYSKQLLAQSAIDVDNVIKDDMLRVIAVGVDNAFLNGTGAGNSQPTGILTIGANPAGNYLPTLRGPNRTFGGTPTYANVMQFPSAIWDGNFEDDGTMACITTPKVKGRWKAIPLAVNYPKYLWQGKHDVCDGQFKGYVSKLMDTPNTSLANGVLFGKFSEAIVCQWPGSDIVTDPYSLGDYGQSRVIVTILADVVTRHANAFCYSTDSGAQ